MGGIKYKVLNNALGAPLLSVGFQDYHPFNLYSELNENGVHCKCIIDYKKSGETFHILRFGLPYYETTERLTKAIQILEGIVEKQQKLVNIEAQSAVLPQEQHASGSLSVAA